VLSRSVTAEASLPTYGFPRRRAITSTLMVSGILASNTAVARCLVISAHKLPLVSLELFTKWSNAQFTKNSLV
jgi:hypothetical protein